MDSEEEVSDSIEAAIDALLPGLEDKDTNVRWCAAKGLASIAERLPSELTDQILDAVLRIFTIHSSSSLNGEFDLPTLAEASWHGACLAIAEMARRGLVGASGEQVSLIISTMSKAIHFDLRKGSHSIGSIVRDAACYVIWSLVRSIPRDNLEPHAMSLAKDLLTVALFDREVHIRRAASAAFQEAVGRTSLFPHGIDVLRITDFYAVSIRKNAFLTVAPQVAQYTEYRQCLYGHLLSVTLKHWDPEVRRLAASSTVQLCTFDMPSLVPPIFVQTNRLLKSKDTAEVHGSLLVLAELASVILSRNTPPDSSEEGWRFQAFRSLDLLDRNLIQKHRNELIVESCCSLVANSLSHHVLELYPLGKDLLWRNILDTGLRHRTITCQDAAVQGYRTVSGLVDFAKELKSFIQEFNRGLPSTQRSIANLLGALRYDLRPELVLQSLEAVESKITAKDGQSIPSVETRVACLESIMGMLDGLGKLLLKTTPPSRIRRTLSIFLNGLNDYTVDQRGDVGSWLRMASVKGLSRLSRLIVRYVPDEATLMDYLPLGLFIEIIAGVLKQGMERLDNVRELAGTEIRLLLSCLKESPFTRYFGDLPGQEILEPLLVDEPTWRDAAWLYPLATRLLLVNQYRRSVLKGLALSIGSKTTSTNQPATLSYQNFIEELPLEGNGLSSSLSFSSLTQDIISLLTSDSRQWNVDLGLLQALHILLETESATKLGRKPNGLSEVVTYLEHSLKTLARLKSLPKIDLLMNIVIDLFAVPSLSITATSWLQKFLTHRYPRVRQDTAEALYNAFQSRDFSFETEQAEEILLSAEWTSESNAQTASTQFLDNITDALAQ